jgi:hypothetical protein
VPDETCPRDTQGVEDGDKTLRMRADADVPIRRRVAATESQKVEDNDAVTRRKQRDDIGPEVARGRKPVDEHHGYAATARPGGVVIDTRAGKVEEFTPHRGARAWVEGYG